MGCGSGASKETPIYAMVGVVETLSVKKTPPLKGLSLAKMPSKRKKISNINPYLASIDHWFSKLLKHFHGHTNKFRHTLPRKSNALTKHQRIPVVAICQNYQRLPIFPQSPLPSAGNAQIVIPGDSSGMFHLQMHSQDATWHTDLGMGSSD